MKSLRSLVVALPVLAVILVSSCYYDYGLDTNNLDVVGTFYNKDYNFQNVTKYYFIDSVVHIQGTGNLTRQYDNQIKSTVLNNLNSLGWTRVNDSIGPGIVVVGIVATAGTVTVYNDNDYCWYDYWGYTYCDSYDYSTTYATGTIGILLSDLQLKNGQKVPLQWSAIINGLQDQGNVPSRIQTTINQAFTQSPYLK